MKCAKNRMENIVCYMKGSSIEESESYKKNKTSRIIERFQLIEASVVTKRT